MTRTKPPKYVWFGKIGVCAMRLFKHQDTWDQKAYKGPTYYRDAGHWECHAVMNEEGQWISKNCYDEDMDYLSGEILTPCTKEEWRESNKGYL